MADKTLTGVVNLGLGDILRTHKLAVPANQREYSWTSSHVTTLLQDFAEAIREGGEDYFLGTIVVVSKDDYFEIVDGQQRLATTAILLSAIRDYLRPTEPTIADTIERDYLSASSENMRELEPKIKLNLADNNFFANLISGKKQTFKPIKASHDLLQSAYDESALQVKRIVSAYEPKLHGDVLVSWLKFIQKKAQVVLLTISSDGNAYRMFETLNDRGLKTTQADLVKNYLFGRAGARLNEAQDKWAAMRGTLESLDDEAVPTVMYLRHAVMLKRGYFRENALHDNIQQEVKSPGQAVTFLDTLESLSLIYAALFNPESDQWNGYPDAIRQAIKVLNLLNIAGLRPLMLAVAAKFSKKEAAAAFRKFISWEVRFIIAGSTLTGGYIEVPLAVAAKKVFDGEIADHASLTKEMLSRLPNDDQFEKAFASATSSKPSLARYYLRSLEIAATDLPEPEFIPNDDRETINLEHVLPQKPMGNWPAFSEADAKAYVKRIGNMVLMQAKQNSDLKSAAFEDKQAMLKASPYQLTSMVGALPDWTPQSVADRQARLAKFALKAWPL